MLVEFIGESDVKYYNNFRHFFQDYFVLLPEDFYLATILNQEVEKPCTMNETDLCRHYAYPNITMFDKSWGVGGFIPSGGEILQLEEWFKNTEVVYLKK